MMLAEVTNFSPPVEIASWLACAAFAIWFLLLCDKGISRMRGASPEPPNGELKQSIKQLNARMKTLEDWRSQLTQKMEVDKTEILAAGSKRGKEIYDHIDDVRKELAEKIDDMPSKIIADLVNAKKL